MFGDAVFDIPTGAMYDVYDNWGGTNVVVLAKSGDYYTCYCNSTSMVFGQSAYKPIGSQYAMSIPLVIGGRWNYEGEAVQYLTGFTLDDIRIYDRALSSGACLNVYNELKG